MENKKKGNSKNNALSKALEFAQSPIFIGICLTLIFCYLASIYYNKKAEHENLREPSIVYDVIELIDLKTTDFRFKLRGPIEPKAPVALLTIDDRSIEEVGRWPWGRDKIAHIIDQMMKYNAKAIGFDIVFSEAQEDPTLNALNRIEKNLTPLPDSVKQAFENEKSKSQPDKALADVLEKYKDRLILGSFAEEKSTETKVVESTSYQDYCRNEAFKRANSEKFVKLNPTFVVDDQADLYVDVNLDPIFEQIFSVSEKITMDTELKNRFKKSSFTDLNEQEIKQLQFLTETQNMRFCSKWLTPQDEYYEPLKKEYEAAFAKVSELAGKDVDTMIASFKNSVKDHPIAQHEKWTINTDQIQDKAEYTASFNAEIDKDGVIRSKNMFFRTGNRIGLSFIPTLSLETYLVANGYQAIVEINTDPSNQKQKKITKFEIKDPNTDQVISEIPVDAQAKLAINYAGGTNSFPYLPAKELLNDKKTATVSQAKFNSQTKRWETLEFEVDKAEFINGKSFIFGATAIGVYDLRVTPFEKAFPGPETHLNMLANLFDKNFIKTVSNEKKIMLFSILVVGGLFSIFIAQSGAVIGFSLTALCLIVVFVLDQYLLKQGLVTTMALPAIFVLFLYTALTFYKYLTEERKKKHLRSTFSKYVSPAIVDEILKDPENIELGGKKIRMSVSFSDVRGFTTISEKLDPSALSDVLNMYLTPMTNIIFQNKGTLDKYMGDAIMAFFGAPIYFPDHATHACRCALQSIEKLKQIQLEFKAKNLPEIDIGIGINTGDMSVGNMGSDIVRSYTVMGDSVNLGSRLEGINKEYGTRIIISQFTHAEVKDKFVTREVDQVKVKGKNEPVKIFELIAEGSTTKEINAMLLAFNQGYTEYQMKKFTEAISSFKKGLATVPNDPVCELYIERCEEYLVEPPPENWDGVFVMKTK